MKRRVPPAEPTRDQPCEKCNYRHPPDAATPSEAKINLSHDLLIDLLPVPALHFVTQDNSREAAPDASPPPLILLDLFHSGSLLLI